MRTASDRLPRWLAPPPARTAAFSRARRPGRVLRVSRMRQVAAGGVDVGPGQGGDAGKMAEEVEGAALAAQDGTERAGDLAEVLPGVRVAVGRVPGDRDRRVELGEDLGGRGRAGQDARPRATKSPGRWRCRDERRRRDVAEHAEVLGQRPGHGGPHGVRAGRNRGTPTCSRRTDAVPGTRRRRRAGVDEPLRRLCGSGWSTRWWRRGTRAVRWRPPPRPGHGDEAAQLGEVAGSSGRPAAAVSICVDCRRRSRPAPSRSPPA